MRLQGKIAIITGAADGIGRGAAVKFAKEGADSLLVDINEAGLKETAAAVAKTGRKAKILVQDVAAPDAGEKIVARAIADFGRLDILVNNAGVSQGGFFTDIPPETLDRVIAVNLIAPFLISQAAARHWLATKTRGRIVSTSSINAETVQGNSTAYCASKGGVRTFTRGAAVDLGPHQITVNAVGPGHTITGMTRKHMGTQWEKDGIERSALKRLGTPEDIANAMAFLASDEASYITGQTIYVEGGRTIQPPPYPV